MLKVMWMTLATAMLAAGASTSGAAEGTAPVAEPAALPPAEAAAPPVAAPRANPFGVKPVEPSALGRKRGGTNVLNEMKLKGVVADNQASHLTTGNNVLSDGAFSGSSGMPMVIQNSGNNVLIQNATIVNVQVK